MLGDVNTLRACATSRPSTPSCDSWRLFAARERGGPLPSIAVADALLDERRELAELGNQINPVASEFLIGPPLLSSEGRQAIGPDVDSHLVARSRRSTG
jgi:hypothetical protein